MQITKDCYFLFFFFTQKTLNENLKKKEKKDLKILTGTCIAAKQSFVALTLFMKKNYIAFFVFSVQVICLNLCFISS